MAPTARPDDTPQRHTPAARPSNRFHCPHFAPLGTRQLPLPSSIPGNQPAQRRTSGPPHKPSANGTYAFPLHGPPTPARPGPERAPPSASEVGNPRDPPAPPLGDYDATASPPHEPLSQNPCAHRPPSGSRAPQRGKRTEPSPTQPGTSWNSRPSLPAKPCTAPRALESSPVGNQGYLRQREVGILRHSQRRPAAAPKLRRPSSVQLWGAERSRGACLRTKSSTMVAIAGV